MSNKPKAKAASKPQKKSHYPATTKKHLGPIYDAPPHKFFVFLLGQASPIGMEVAGWTQKHAEKRLLKMLREAGVEVPARVVPCRSSENWPGVQTIGHGARLATTHSDTTLMREAA